MCARWFKYVKINVLYARGGVGLQDENLFMYCDERDMAVRSAQKGYLEAVTKEVLAWHQHINATGAHRDPRTQYLIARNYIYLSRKHFSRTVQIRNLIIHLIIQVILFFRDIRQRERRTHFKYYLKGVAAGLKGDMDNSFMNS